MQLQADSLVFLTDTPGLLRDVNDPASRFERLTRGEIERHRRLMVAAFTISTLFLISYLTYHAQVGSVRFPGHGAVRPVYFAILISHTILAASVPPLAGITLYLGWKRRDERHRRLARCS